MRFAEMRRVRGLVLVAACHTDLGLQSEAVSGYYSRPWGPAPSSLTMFSVPDACLRSPNPPPCPPPLPSLCPSSHPHNCSGTPGPWRRCYWARQSGTRSGPTAASSCSSPTAATPSSPSRRGLTPPHCAQTARVPPGPRRLRGDGVVGASALMGSARTAVPARDNRPP